MTCALLTMGTALKSKVSSQFGRRAVRRWGPNRGRMWLNAELDSQNSLELVDRIRFGKKRGVLDKECLHSVR